MHANRMSGGWLVVAVVAALGPFGSASAAEQARASAPPTVLDTHSYWRSFVVLRPVVFAEKAEGAAVPDGPPRTDPPPTDWTGPDFADGGWMRAAGPVFAGPDGYGWVRQGGGAREVSLLCLRGKFAVSEPAKVQSLTLSATYRGGIVVYLNGVEVARGHLGQGKITPDSLAEAYPWEAYASADGRSPIDYRGGKRPADEAGRLALRLRRLDGLSIPATNLRKGVNVLAIELHRSPVHPQADKFPKGTSAAWSTCGLNGLELAAAPASAVQSNTHRPRGVQVWNESPIADVYDMDYGDPNEPLRPIELVGAPNGSFSGQVVVGSDSPIKGLRAEMSALASAGGKQAIPADRTRILYPQPTGRAGQEGRSFRGLRREAMRFDALAESPPADVPIYKAELEKDYAGPPPVFGAVQPVRVTVHVPPDAGDGDYEGTLTLAADGLNATAVPVRIRVIGWTLPDAGRFTSLLGIVQSAETLALYYKVPLWSQRHWELIDRSLAILGRAGVDTLYLPLVMKFHWGRESLVRWVRQEDGSFSHDYALFEKYVDTALRHVKTPEVVCLYAWDRKYRTYERDDRMDIPQRAAKYERLQKEGIPHPIVPLLDPKTGEVGELEAPIYCDAKSVGFWKPVLEGCRERLLKRGVAPEAIMLGIVPDGRPAPETIDVFHEAAPWAEWLQVSHAPGSYFKGAKIDGVKVVHAAGVYGGTRRVPDPDEKRWYGWKPYSERTRIFAVFPRVGAPYTMLSQTGLAEHWVFQEAYLMSGLRGVTRVGGEFWPVTPQGLSAGARATSLVGAYSSNIPGLGQAVHDLLAPGPDGALSTLRLETLYEGSQEGEARVFIEKALEFHKDKLAGMQEQLQALLDSRARIFRAYCPIMDCYAGSDWQARSEKIYRAAASVAKAIGKE